MRRNISGVSLFFLACLAACGRPSEAEEAVRYLMKDPEATQFRDVAVCADDRSVTSGDYNAKNEYGAYVGFKPFFYSKDEGVAFAGDANFMPMMNRCYGSTSDDPIALTGDETLGAELPAETTDDVVPQSEPEEIVATDPESASCFGDYCPCETADPDYGGMDVTLCRNLEQGYPVGEDHMAAGAASRDARRALREFENDHSEY